MDEEPDSSSQTKFSQKVSSRVWLWTAKDFNLIPTSYLPWYIQLQTLVHTDPPPRNIQSIPDSY